MKTEHTLKLLRARLSRPKVKEEHKTLNPMDVEGTLFRFADQHYKKYKDHTYSSLQKRQADIQMKKIVSDIKNPKKE